MLLDLKQRRINSIDEDSTDTFYEINDLEKELLSKWFSELILMFDDIFKLESADNSYNDTHSTKWTIDSFGDGQELDAAFTLQMLATHGYMIKSINRVNRTLI